MMIYKSRCQLYFPFRFLKWKLGSRSPLSMVLKITNKCNLDCLHCPWKHQNGNDLSTAQWYTIIDKAKKMGCILCIIEGGEPLMRKDIGEIVDYAKTKGLFVTVITNGTINLSSVHPHAFWISLDGVGETYDAIRGKGNFQKVMDNIKQNQQKYMISLTTLSTKNVTTIEDICSTLYSLVDGIWFNFFYPYTGVEQYELSMDEKRNAAEFIMKLKQKYPIINSKTYLSSVGRPWKCNSWATLNVSHTGRFHHGCTVEQLEPCQCDKCDMSCYAEQSHASRLRFDSIQFLLDAIGFQRSRLIFLKQKTPGEDKK